MPGPNLFIFLLIKNYKKMFNALVTAFSTPYYSIIYFSKYSYDVMATFGYELYVSITEF